MVSARIFYCQTVQFHHANKKPWSDCNSCSAANLFGSWPESFKKKLGIGCDNWSYWSILLIGRSPESTGKLSLLPVRLPMQYHCLLATDTHWHKLSFWELLIFFSKENYGFIFSKWQREHPLLWSLLQRASWRGPTMTTWYSLNLMVSCSKNHYCCCFSVHGSNS